MDYNVQITALPVKSNGYHGNTIFRYNIDVNLLFYPNIVLAFCSENSQPRCAPANSLSENGLFPIGNSKKSSVIIFKYMGNDVMAKSEGPTKSPRTSKFKLTFIGTRTRDVSTFCCRPRYHVTIQTRVFLILYESSLVCINCRLFVQQGTFTIYLFGPSWHAGAGALYYNSRHRSLVLNTLHGGLYKSLQRSLVGELVIGKSSGPRSK